MPQPEVMFVPQSCGSISQLCVPILQGQNEHAFFFFFFSPGTEDVATPQFQNEAVKAPTLN